MALGSGFVSFILLNSLLLAMFCDGRYYLTGIFLILAIINLIILTLICKKVDTP